jgi:hypothetical protein
MGYLVALMARFLAVFADLPVSRISMILSA